MKRNSIAILVALAIALTASVSFAVDGCISGDTVIVYPHVIAGIDNQKEEVYLLHHNNGWGARDFEKSRMTARNDGTYTMSMKASGFKGGKGHPAKVAEAAELLQGAEKFDWSNTTNQGTSTEGKPIIFKPCN